MCVIVQMSLKVALKYKPQTGSGIHSFLISSIFRILTQMAGEKSTFHTEKQVFICLALQIAGIGITDLGAVHL